jgi:hypothetical protein
MEKYYKRTLKSERLFFGIDKSCLMHNLMIVLRVGGERSYGF